MSKISLAPNAAGTGNFTIASPNGNTDRTLTLPDQTGTVLTGSGAIGVNASAPSSSVNIDSSGNVGIGTSSPTNQLSVNGSGRFYGSYTEDTTNIGIHAGYLNSTARMGFFNGTAAQNWQIDNNAGTFRWFTPGLTHMQIDSNGNLAFNSGYGSAATAYGCRAWVNFNGTGTVTIRASGNVTSITDNGTGDYTINFTTAMPDADYAASAIAQRNVTGSANQSGLIFIPANGTTVRQTSSSFRVMTTDQIMGVQDALVLTVMIVR